MSISRGPQRRLDEKTGVLARIFFASLTTKLEPEGAQPLANLRALGDTGAPVDTSG